MDDFDKSKLHHIMIVLLLQSFLLLFVAGLREVRALDIIISKDVFLNFVLLIGIGLSILSIIMVKELFKLIKHELDFRMQEVKLEESKKNVKVLRSQKHDFANHLQTIYGLVQLDKKEEIKEYITSLSQDLKQLKLEKEEESILDSILSPKQKEAGKLKVELNYRVEEGIENIDLSLNKTFRIASNLVDNAIDAASQAKEGVVKIKGESDKKGYRFSIYNNGSIIEKELLEQVFQPGFSTKGNDRGFGLHIIQSLVKESGGRLEVKSKEGFGTEFCCFFPKKNKEYH